MGTAAIRGFELSLTSAGWRGHLRRELSLGLGLETTACSALEGLSNSESSLSRRKEDVLSLLGGKSRKLGTDHPHLPAPRLLALAARLQHERGLP